MKHLKYLFLFIGLALFASCNESDVEGGVIADKNQVKFSGVVKELQTRVTGTSWDENDAIGIYALIGEQEVVYDNMLNVQYKTTKGDGVFAPVGSAIAFPNDGGNLDFVAYYPYDNNLSDLEYTVERGTDLLYSNNATGKNKETPDVSLEFKHALSKLVLNVGLGANVESLEGLTATINNVSTTGKVNLANGDVTVDAAGSITPTVVLAEENTAATITELVMPTQDLQNVEIEFTLGDNTYKWSPKAETVLASNMQYAYKFNLKVEAGELVAVEIGTATIGEWEKGHEDDVFTDLDPEVDEEKGTKDNPYTVAEAFANQGAPKNTDYIWVKGYIVGYKNNGSYDVEFSVNGASGSNIIIADSKDEADETKALGVQLPTGDARTDLNLANNPHMYKAEVLLKGTLEAYFASDEGLKNVKEYVLLFANPFFTTDVTEVELAASGDLISGTVAIDTNDDQAWTATSDADWLTVTPSGIGSDDVTLTAEVNTNAERNAQVTLTPTGETGLAPIVVTVTQVAAGESPKGTKENPYNVAEAIDSQGETGVWVKGFIVGSHNSGSIFGINNPSEYNLNIADDKNTTEGADVVNVQLPAGDMRNLSLKVDPSLYKAEIVFKGDLTTYNGLPGIKNTKEYEILSEGGSFFISDETELYFQATGDAITQTIEITTLDTETWSVASDVSWLTVAPASGTGSGSIGVTAQENSAETERTATVTITPTANTDLTPIVINITQGGTIAPPPELLFPGSDFNDWSAFLGAVTEGRFKGKENATGGRNDSGAMLLDGKAGGNDYVFTAAVPEGFSAAGKTEINFWIKGTATGKSLSMNVHTDDSNYKPYNLGDASNSPIVLEYHNQNDYVGAIDTNDQWIKVTLDISTIDINTTPGEKLFALKVGKTADYDLLIDYITIE